MDLIEKNADYNHFFNSFRLFISFLHIMLDKEYSRDKMNIRTEAKAMLEKILSSKKSQWPQKN